MTFNPPAAPAAPNTAQPATFQADADAFAAWMAAFGSAINGAGGLLTLDDISRGNNASGEYIRFADGTQICTARTTASSAGDATWSFPAQFLTSAGLVVTATHTGSADNYNAGVRAPDTTSCGFNVWDAAGVRKTAGVSLMAVGRWY